jgi:hypothetical protein
MRLGIFDQRFLQIGHLIAEVRKILEICARQDCEERHKLGFRDVVDEGEIDCIDQCALLSLDHMINGHLTKNDRRELICVDHSINIT